LYFWSVNIESMKYLFLDTNIYLHYHDFEQLDWKSLACSGDDFTIIVPQVILQEINEQKDRNRGKIQKRAKKIAAKFADYFLKEIKNQKNQITTCKNPSDTDFDGVEFSRHSNDDIFILSAIKSIYDNNDIILVSNDTGLLLKAKSNNLPFFVMPDEYRIKEESSEEEKELISTKKELEKYKNRLPKPYITFPEKQILLELTKPIFRDIEKELNVFMDNLKSEHPYKKQISNPYKKQVNTLYESMTGLNSSTIEKNKDIDIYNKGLDEYYSEYEIYQRFKIKNDILSERFEKIEFELHNDGSSQTGELIIFIEFYNDVFLYNEQSKDYMDEEAPKPPSMSMGSLRHLKNIRSYLPDLYRIYCWNETKRLNTNKIELCEGKFNHGLCKKLNIENSIYVDTATCGNFNIKWTISDPELTDIVKGVLNIVVK